jgi:hypothetical protein
MASRTFLCISHRWAYLYQKFFANDMVQFVLTIAAAKRLIGKALAVHPTIKAALSSATLVIVAGTTNGYAAEEILKYLGQAEEFSKRRFFPGHCPAAGKDHADGKAAG